MNQEQTPTQNEHSLVREHSGSFNRLVLIMAAFSALFGSAIGKILPSPDTSKHQGESIAASTHAASSKQQQLRTMLTDMDLNAFELFLRRRTKHQDPQDPVEWLQTLDMPPQTFAERNYVGACTAEAEFAAYWAHLHSYQPYVVTIWPKGSMSKVMKRWHKFTIFRAPDKEGKSQMYAVDSRGVLPIWSLQWYMREGHEREAIVPGGIRKWEGPSEDFIDLLQNNFFADSGGFTDDKDNLLARVYSSNSEG